MRISQEADGFEINKMFVGQALKHANWRATTAMYIYEHASIYRDLPFL
jgi:hypothetical protein